MKKFFALMFAAMFLFAGCSTTPEESPKVKEIKQQREKEKQLAEQKAVEEKKLAEQKADAEKQLAEQKTPEDKQLAEQKTPEDKQLAEQKAAEEKRLAEEKRRQEQAERALAEKDAFQNWNSKITYGVSAVDEHWESLWQYTLNSASNGSMGVQEVFQNLRELEHRLIDDEMIFQNATVPQEMSQGHSKKMNTIKQGFASWAKLRRKACETFRFAVMDGNITPQVIQESMDTINKADAFMIRSTAELVDLENEINNR